ncbi:MAG TPA: hypothetical protein VJT31_35260 [Rugosimonospora sp.]|nr:hypothetical protein [Rugosimonospora sp.]
MNAYYRDDLEHQFVIDYSRQNAALLDRIGDRSGGTVDLLDGPIPRRYEGFDGLTADFTVRSLWANALTTRPEQVFGPDEVFLIRTVVPHPDTDGGNIKHTWLEVVELRDYRSLQASPAARERVRLQLFGYARAQYRMVTQARTAFGGQASMDPQDLVRHLRRLTNAVAERPGTPAEHVRLRTGALRLAEQLLEGSDRLELSVANDLLDGTPAEGRGWLARGMLETLNDWLDPPLRARVSFVDMNGVELPARRTYPGSQQTEPGVEEVRRWFPKATVRTSHENEIPPLGRVQLSDWFWGANTAPVWVPLRGVLERLGEVAGVGGDAALAARVGVEADGEADVLQVLRDVAYLTAAAYGLAFAEDELAGMARLLVMLRDGDGPRVVSWDDLERAAGGFGAGRLPLIPADVRRLVALADQAPEAPREAVAAAARTFPAPGQGGDLERMALLAAVAAPDHLGGPGFRALADASAALGKGAPVTPGDLETVTGLTAQAFGARYTAAHLAAMVRLVSVLPVRPAGWTDLQPAIDELFGEYRSNRARFGPEHVRWLAGAVERFAALGADPAVKVRDAARLAAVVFGAEYEPTHLAWTERLQSVAGADNHLVTLNLLNAALMRWMREPRPAFRVAAADARWLAGLLHGQTSAANAANVVAIALRMAQRAYGGQIRPGDLDALGRLLVVVGLGRPQVGWNEFEQALRQVRGDEPHASLPVGPTDVRALSALARAAGYTYPGQQLTVAQLTEFSAAWIATYHDGSFAVARPRSAAEEAPAVDLYGPDGVPRGGVGTPLAGTSTDTLPHTPDLATLLATGREMRRGIAAEVGAAHAAARTRLEESGWTLRRGGPGAGQAPVSHPWSSDLGGWAPSTPDGEPLEVVTEAMTARGLPPHAAGDTLAGVLVRRRVSGRSRPDGAFQVVNPDTGAAVHLLYLMSEEGSVPLWAEEPLSPRHVDHFRQLAENLGWSPEGSPDSESVAGSDVSERSERSERSENSATHEVFDFVSHVVFEGRSLRRDFLRDGAHLYQAQINGTGVLVRALVDPVTETLLRAEPATPLDEAYARAPQTLDALMDAGWRVEPSHTNSFDAAGRVLRLDAFSVGAWRTVESVVLGQDLLGRDQNGRYALWAEKVAGAPPGVLRDLVALVAAASDGQVSAAERAYAGLIDAVAAALVDPSAVEDIRTAWQALGKRDEQPPEFKRELLEALITREGAYPAEHIRAVSKALLDCKDLDARGPGGSG